MPVDHHGSDSKRDRRIQSSVCIGGFLTSVPDPSVVPEGMTIDMNRNDCPVPHARTGTAPIRDDRLRTFEVGTESDVVGRRQRLKHTERPGDREVGGVVGEGHSRDRGLTLTQRPASRGQCSFGCHQPQVVAVVVVAAVDSLVVALWALRASSPTGWPHAVAIETRTAATIDLEIVMTGGRYEHRSGFPTERTFRTDSRSRLVRVVAKL